MEINEIIKQSINLLLKEKSVNVIKSKQFLNDVYPNINRSILATSNINKFYFSDVIKNEGLIKTYPTIKLLEALSKKYPLNADYIASYSPDENEEIYGVNIVIIPIDKFNDKMLSDLKLDVDKFGYFVSSLWRDNKTVKINEMFEEYIVIQIEPKYFKCNNSIPKFLYHITNKSSVNKILKNGFVPKINKTSFLNHPERVYFFTKLPNNETIQLFINDLKTYGSNIMKMEEYYLITIDTSYLNNTVKFFEDANFPDENAVYTLDNETNKSIFNVKLC